jgi:hypothetical protein
MIVDTAVYESAPLAEIVSRKQPCWELRIRKVPARDVDVAVNVKLLGRVVTALEEAVITEESSQLTRA